MKSNVFYLSFISLGPCMYCLYPAAVNSESVNSNLPPAWSSAQQQQLTDQQRGRGNGQNTSFQQTSSIGDRLASTSGRPSAGNSGDPPLTLQYTS